MTSGFSSEFARLTALRVDSPCGNFRETGNSSCQRWFGVPLNGVGESLWGSPNQGGNCA